MQPDINAKLNAVLRKLGMANDDFVTRTTGCPNGCARPYMAEIAFVGSGPNAYQLWLGGSPDQVPLTLTRTLTPTRNLLTLGKATALQVGRRVSPMARPRTLTPTLTPTLTLTLTLTLPLTLALTPSR